MKNKRNSRFTIFHQTMADEVADILLMVKAMKLDPVKPFTWASGWRSPVYCNNRKLPSNPVLFRKIIHHFQRVIKTSFPEDAVIAGVATGGIPTGAILAYTLNRPFIYVRTEEKTHGDPTLVEGDLRRGQRVVVIEDLISTGQSTLTVVEKIRKAGGVVIGVVAITSHKSQKAIDLLEDQEFDTWLLTDTASVIRHAGVKKYFIREQQKALEEWLAIGPQAWSERYLQAHPEEQQKSE